MGSWKKAKNRLLPRQERYGWLKDRISFNEVVISIIRLRQAGWLSASQTRSHQRFFKKLYRG